MAPIPLEDTFVDIVGKAQRGLKWSDETLASRAGLTVNDITRVKAGEVDDAVLRKLASALNLGANALVVSARKAWQPEPVSLSGLAQFNTPYEDMTVNSYLVWDAKTGEAAAFDTGASCEPMLEWARGHRLAIKLIFLTHTHPDHIADLAKLTKATEAPVFVCELEPVPGAQTFAAGRTFRTGALQIATRQTTGHSIGAITYVISGLEKPVAIVGDALFAGSMGGGAISFSDALANNRRHIFTLSDQTLLCPGHGPLTTVAEEKRHNPFYPEFQSVNPQ